MNALGQRSMVPPFYANRAKVAPRARTAHTAREAPSMGRGLPDLQNPLLGRPLPIIAAPYSTCKTRFRMIRGLGDNTFARGSPFSRPPPPRFRAQTSGSPKGSGEGLGTGVWGYPPPTSPQNNPQHALCIWRCVSWGNVCSEHYTSGSLGGPISELMDPLKTRALTFEPLFHIPLQDTNVEC